jgi:hypothetical protein
MGKEGRRNDRDKVIGTLGTMYKRKWLLTFY